jgi:hypothetical protein
LPGPPLQEEESNQGILVQSLNELFNRVRDLQSVKKIYIIRCSYFEIYNDSVYDLLVENQDSFSDALQVNEDIKVSFVICNLSRKRTSTSKA